jgi:hypothetical protein
LFFKDLNRKTLLFSALPVNRTSLYWSVFRLKKDNVVLSVPFISTLTSVVIKGKYRAAWGAGDIKNL